MKAYVLHGVNDLRYEETVNPECPEGWVVVKVKAAGICSSDIPRIFTKGTYHFPTIPGHEFAGIVERVGDSVDKGLIGKHVGVFPLIPCRACDQCHDRHYEMCRHYDYVGSRRDGGFAEFVAVPAWNLVILDPSVPFVHAAMLEPLSVALHAMRMSGLELGCSVGVIGTGMIGICAARWAECLGAAKVVVIGRNESKRSIVETCGLEYVNSERQAVSSQFDVVLEAVGSPQAVCQAIGAVVPKGKVVLMGNPSSDILLPQDIYWQILRRQLTMTGTWNSSYDGTLPSDWTDAVDALRTGKVIVEPLISHLFPQEELPCGLEIMRRHTTPYCKVMTVWNP